MLRIAPTTLRYRLTFDTGDYEWKASMKKILDKQRQDHFDPASDLWELSISLLFYQFYPAVLGTPFFGLVGSHWSNWAEPNSFQARCIHLMF